MPKRQSSILDWGEGKEFKEEGETEDILLLETDEIDNRRI